MQGRIELKGRCYDVSVYGRSPGQRIQIGDGLPQAAVLNRLDSGEWEIQLGGQRAKAWLQVKGETVYIRAFGQTFTLSVVNPVEQAALGPGGSRRRAIAPMPGVVVDTHVAEGDTITKGQLMLTIESMKILTAIKAPLNGRVAKLHFTTGQSFDKGAVLVALGPEDK